MIGVIVGLALVVVEVSDGDTLTVMDGDTTTPLRLAEIDAPERRQPYSQVSQRNLDESCRMARAVDITPVDTDRYGRSASAGGAATAMTEMRRATSKSGLCDVGASTSDSSQWPADY